MNNDWIILRKLARSTRWQILYNQVKEIGSLKLFENSSDLSYLQIQFLQWLSIYNNLEERLHIGDELHLSRDVIDDDLRLEAYLLYRSKHKNDKKNKKAKIKGHDSIPSVLFKRKRK